MIKKLFSFVFLVGSLGCWVVGCQTTSAQKNASTDYRTDQASRQTERDMNQNSAKSKPPMEDPKRDRQDVIDQPR